MSAIRKIVRFSNSQEILIMKHILRKNYKNSYELYPNYSAVIYIYITL